MSLKGFVHFGLRMSVWLYECEWHIVGKGSVLVGVTRNGVG